MKENRDTMHKISIAIPNDQAETVAQAFLSGESAPFAFDFLGGEEFRRLIGLVYPEDVALEEDEVDADGAVVTPAGTVVHRQGEVDLDSPVDLGAVSVAQGLELAEACVRAFMRQVIVSAAAEAQRRAAEAAAQGVADFI